MLRLTSIALLALAAPVAAQEATAPAASPVAADLEGRWDVSLYFSPNQPPSSTVMVIKSTEGGALNGTFYNSEISVGRVAVHEGEVLFTAVTEDGSGPYLHSGRLVGGTIKGQTLSTGRDFLMAWEATKSPSSGL